ncbi:MAG: M56 family metallopeptidase [Lachnospiraceae bacterium]|nr:M56 family metallopeptidase [Lachnospiraceae bacterium]
MTGLEMILSSSLAIVVVLLLRKLLGKKCNPNIRYMLWFLVAVRILLPIEFALEVEQDSFVASVVETGEETREQIVENFVRADVERQELVEGRTQEQRGNISEEKNFVTGVSDSEFPQISEDKPVEKGLDLVKLFGGMWIVGSVGLALFWIALNIYSFSRIKKRKVADMDTPIPVYEVEEINGLVGVMRPKIFISTQIVEDIERRGYVLAHELQHYKAGDHIWQFVRCLCVIAQWFNPLVWVAYFKSQEDCELACDYRVLKGLEEGEHANYAETLLHILRVNKGRSQVLITAMCNDKKSMKTRLEGILKKQNRKPMVAVVVAVIVLVVVGVSFLTWQVKATSAEESEDIAQEEKETIYDFQQEDLDGDGLGDRIYKTMLGESVCNYRLELGNGEKIDLGIEASTYTVPIFEFVDLTGDGKQDIIYKAEPPFTANGGFWTLDFVILVAGENGYEVTQLPFYEGGETGLSKYLSYEYEFVADDMVEVRVPDYDYEIMIPYGENTPLEYYYEAGITMDYYVGGPDNKPVSGIWDYYLDTTSTPAKVVCCNNLFDQWSVCGLNVVLGYEDDVFVVEEILFDENVYGDEAYANDIKWVYDKGNSSDEVVAFTNEIEVHLPENWIDNYKFVIDNASEEELSVLFYDKKNVNAGEDGYLFSLNLYKKGIVEPQLLIFSNEKVFGIYKDGSSEYALVMRPCREGGVYSETDEALKQSYMDLYNSIGEVRIIAENMNGFIPCGIDAIEWMGYVDGDYEKERKDEVRGESVTIKDDLLIGTQETLQLTATCSTESADYSIELKDISGNTVQTIEYHPEDWWADSYEPKIQLQDVNNDGVDDIWLYLGCRGNAVIDGWTCFVYDEILQQYIEIEGFDELANPFMNEWLKTGSKYGWGVYVRSVYEVEGTKLVLLENLTETNVDYEGKVWLYDEEIYENGVLVSKKEGVYADEITSGYWDSVLMYTEDENKEERYIHVFPKEDVVVVPEVPMYSFENAKELGEVVTVDDYLPGLGFGTWYTVEIDGIEYYYGKYDHKEEVETFGSGYSIVGGNYSLENGIYVGMAEEEVLRIYPNMAVMDFEGNYIYEDVTGHQGWNGAAYPCIKQEEADGSVAHVPWSSQFDYVMIGDIDLGTYDTLPLYVGLMMKDKKVAAITFYYPTAG